MMVPPPARREDDDDDNDKNKDDDDLSRDRRRAEGGEGNVNDGVDDEHVRIWQIPRMGDGGDCGVTATMTMTLRRADCTPPPRRQRRCASWQRGCVPPAVNGSGQRRERATSAMVATTNTLMGVSGVRIGRIPGMGDGGDCGATVTTMTTSRRADRIAPH